MNTPLTTFISKINAGETISFSETMAVIADHYQYQPTRFTNGLEDDLLINEAGNNEGSCKIFAFAQLHQLNKQQTLELFGDYYRIDVLPKSEETSHQNIRNFIKYGWNGINFDKEALTATKNLL
jgi:hypothetical protein